MKKLMVMLLALGSFMVFSHEANASTVTDSAEINGNSAKVEVNDEQYLEFEKGYLGSLEGISIEPEKSNNNDSSFIAAAVVPIRSYNKTITMTFSNTNFPSSTKYSEYKYNGWYRGTLTFQSSKKSGNSYIATYSGALFISN